VILKEVVRVVEGVVEALSYFIEKSNDCLNYVQARLRSTWAARRRSRLAEEMSDVIG
jgi:hypothetical protein